MVRDAYVHHLRGEWPDAVERLRDAIGRGYSPAKALREPGLARLADDPDVAAHLGYSLDEHPTAP